MRAATPRPRDLAIPLGLVAWLTACAATPPPKPEAPIAPSQPTAAEPRGHLPPEELLLEVEARDADLLTAVLSDFAFESDLLRRVKTQGLLDESAPAVAAVTLDLSGLRVTPRPQTATARAVASFATTERWLSENASSLNATVQRAADGNVHYQTPRERCTLSQGKKGASSRLICGAEPSSSRVTPYLAMRPSGLQTAQTELVAKVPVATLDARFGALLDRAAPLLPVLMKSELSRRGPRVSRLLLPAAGTLSREGLALLHDVKELNLTVTRDGNIWEPNLVVSFRERRGFIAQVVTDVAKNAGTPESFFALPKDAELAGFSARVPEVRARELEQGVAQWLRSVFGPGFTESSELIAKTFLPDAAMAYAHGDATGRDADSTLMGGARLRANMLSAWGWHVAIYDEPATSYAPMLVRGADAYNNGELKRLSYRELPSLCPGLPPIVRGSGAGLPAGWDRGSMRMDAKLFNDCWSRGGWPGRAPTTEGAELVVLLAPDGKRARLGVSADQADLVKRLTPGGASLGEDETLSWLRDETALAGGFVTLRGLGSLARNITQFGHPNLRRARFDALPDAGKTRALWKITALPDGSISLRARLDARAHTRLSPLFAR